MHVVTDDERRRVAAALRRADAERLDRVYGNDPSHAPLTLGLVAEAAGLHYAPYEVTAVEVRNRLADLIDPGDMSQGRRDIVACDREALLALADKARKLGDEENGPASFAVRCTFRVFARSIYKALGEVPE